MKVNLAPLKAAAALALACSGHSMAAPVTAAVDDIAYLNGAPVVLSGSSGASLAYSVGENFDGQDTDHIGGVIGTLNLGMLKVRGLNGVEVSETYLPDDFGDLIRTSSTASLPVDGYTLDTTTGRILSVSTSGGIEHAGSRISGTLTGGVATMSTLRFDLVNQHVYADLKGIKAPVGGLPSISYNLPDTLLWTIGSVSGPARIDPAALALTGQARIDALVGSGFTWEGGDLFSARIELSKLAITNEGFDFLKHSLGLLSTGVGNFFAVNAGRDRWGSTTLNLRFSVSAVPEPSAYALAGVGLLVVWGARRARR